MLTSTTSLTSRQIKVTLPSQVYYGIKVKAEALGLSLSAYLRHLAIGEVKSDIYPSFKATNQVEHSYHQALSHRNQAKKTGDVDSYFDNL